MTKDDIIRMAREAGFAYSWSEAAGKSLERFAALVAAAEREAIAQSLDKQADLAADDIDRQWAMEMAKAVRSRSNK